MPACPWKAIYGDGAQSAATTRASACPGSVNLHTGVRAHACNTRVSSPPCPCQSVRMHHHHPPPPGSTREATRTRHARCLRQPPPPPRPSVPAGVSYDTLPAWVSDSPCTGTDGRPPQSPVAVRARGGGGGMGSGPQPTGAVPARDGTGLARYLPKCPKESKSRSELGAMAGRQQAGSLGVACPGGAEKRRGPGPARPPPPGYDAPPRPREGWCARPLSEAGRGACLTVAAPPPTVPLRAGAGPEVGRAGPAAPAAPLRLSAAGTPRGGGKLAGFARRQRGQSLLPSRVRAVVPEGGVSQLSRSG